LITDRDYRLGLALLRRVQTSSPWACPGLMDSPKCHSSIGGTRFEGVSRYQTLFENALTALYERPFFFCPPL
jgi:hypothetical protein